MKRDEIVMHDKLNFDMTNKRYNNTTKWYCIDSSNNNIKVRYLLGKGEVSKDTIIVIGVNPSTADENKEDSTMTRVKSKLENNSFVMLNIFPLRSTKPSDLPKDKDLDELHRDIHRENLKAISYVLNEIGNDIKVWCAWGSTIDDRLYLKEYLKDIYNLLNKYNTKYYYRGPISKKGNPHHPLYVSDECNFKTFKMDEYINNFQ